MVPTIRTITPTILPLIFVLDLFFIRNGQRASFPTAVDCRAAERGRLRREGCERPYFCKPWQKEWIRNWFKVPWFGDYSLRCERCGRKVWLDQAPVLKLRVTAASYSCECGEVWGAFLNTVPMRAHWLRCEERERMVWPWKIDLLKKMDGPPPIRLIQ